PSRGERDPGRDYPGPVRELGGADDGRSEAPGPGAARVDRERPSPARPRACRYAGQLAPTRSPPVAHHAGLREREGAEDPDDVELDQALDVGAERDHERDGRRGEDDGAVGVDEPVAQVAEL